jgi:hypothetical protein
MASAKRRCPSAIHRREWHDDPRSMQPEAICHPTGGEPEFTS